MAQSIRLVLIIACLQGFIYIVHSKCDGKCVPLAECKSNDFGGENFFDLRAGIDDEVEVDCDHYLEVCCDIEDVVTTSRPIDPVSAAPREPPPSGGPPTIENCGKRNGHGAGFRIKNAQNEAEFGEFPWMVAISSGNGFDDSDSKYICGGSLIRGDVVLTAAHCVVNRTTEKLTVRAGEWDTKTTNEILPYQDLLVTKIVVHENYNPVFHFNNIALLYLEREFDADEHVQLICLPPQGKQFDGQNCVATGWGKDNFYSENYQVILKKVELPVWTKEKCQADLRKTRLGPRFALHNSFTCAGGEEGKDTCTGDGGSPLVCEDVDQPNKYYQAGIVAWGVGCGQAGVPGVYTKNSLYTNWIQQQLEVRNSDNLNSDKLNSDNPNYDY
ncbi:phenoloxidase-activating factor 2-like [Uranotaenia lowii]|uniref:phenoloxidase-activating factor 2-like n=1 Tax=Uranotaenia lowii TaxID=190385 RepID=UPI00247898BC|nr:phenoloxidase-activating factor 2-like [Uranotaenia lowii]